MDKMYPGRMYQGKNPPNLWARLLLYLIAKEVILTHMKPDFRGYGQNLAEDFLTNLSTMFNNQLIFLANKVLQGTDKM